MFTNTKKNYSKLNICSKTAFIGLVFFLIFASCFFWLFFNGAGEIYNGFLLGLAVNIFSFFFMGLGMKKESFKMGYTITLGIVRFLIIGVAIFLSAFLYYKQNIHIFNVFAVIGGYFSCFIVYLILFILKGE